MFETCLQSLTCPEPNTELEVKPEPTELVNTTINMIKRETEPWINSTFNYTGVFVGNIELPSSSVINKVLQLPYVHYAMFSGNHTY